MSRPGTAHTVVSKKLRLEEEKNLLFLSFLPLLSLPSSMSVLFVFVDSFMIVIRRGFLFSNAEEIRESCQALACLHQIIGHKRIRVDLAHVRGKKST